jgi:low temperature requirement protein LtrA
MDLIQLVIVLIVVGVLLWLVTTYIPMDATIKKIITGVVIIAVVLWLLTVFLGGLPHIRVGKM